MDIEATLVFDDRIRSLVESDAKRSLQWDVSPDIKFNVTPERVQVLLRRIMTYFHGLNRPCFAGAVALEVGVSLQIVDKLLTVLVDAGEIAALMPWELKRLGFDEGASVYDLVGQMKPWIAHD